MAPQPSSPKDATLSPAQAPREQRYHAKYIPFQIRISGKESQLVIGMHLQPLLFRFDEGMGSDSASLELANMLMPSLQNNEALHSQLKKELDRTLRLLWKPVQRNENQTATNAAAAEEEPTSDDMTIGTKGIESQLPQFVLIQLEVPLGNKIFLDDIIWDLNTPLNGCGSYAQGVATDLGLPWVTALVISRSLRDLVMSIRRDGVDKFSGVSPLHLGSDGEPLLRPLPAKGPRIVLARE